MKKKQNKKNKHHCLANAIICIPVGSGEHFDEIAEKDRQKRVRVNEIHYGFSCKQY